MVKSKYKYIVVIEQKVTKITEISGLLPRKDALEMIDHIKKYSKKFRHLVKLKRVSADYPGKMESYIKE